LARAHGETSKKGILAPSPHLPCSGLARAVLRDPSGELPHCPVPVSVPSEVCDWVSTGPSTWSYQPSESS